LNRPRVVATAIGAGLLGLLTLLLIGRLRGSGDVPTLVVSKAGFERRVVAEGNLEAAEATPVTAPVNAQGQLKVAWLVPDGTPVKTGDVVVRFDPSELQRSLKDGESDATAAKSRITGMQADTGGAIRNLERDGDMAREELAGADRYKVDDPEVFSRQEIIRSEIDRTLATQRIETSDAVRSIRKDAAKVDLDLLDIERRKAGIAIDRASKGLEALEIKAPHEGILVYKRDWRGEITKVGDTCGRASRGARSRAQDDAGARLRARGRRRAGSSRLAATLVVEAHPRSTYKAKIKKVDTLAKRRTGWIPVQYFGATLELAATDPAVMKPGQRVRAVLALDARAGRDQRPAQRRLREGRQEDRLQAHGRSSSRAGDARAGGGRPRRRGAGTHGGDEIALRDPTAAPGRPAGASAGSTTALPGAR
jgi:hypothetical protein